MNSKWNPFNALTSGEYMINDILKEKNKVKMPILSDDQKQELQERMFEAFNNQEVIKIKYYKDGNIYIKDGKITNIDKNNRKIIINHTDYLFFSQIINFF
ncbi:MAG: YolD-like family protein [Candidatus Coprovivens sp.]